MDRQAGFTDALERFSKGGPGSGNFNHPGYPRGAMKDHHDALVAGGFKHVATTTHNGLEHHYVDSFGGKAIHRIVHGQKPTTEITPPGFAHGSTIGPNSRVHDVIANYHARIGSTALSFRDNGVYEPRKNPKNL
jgi:hypothetical protein